MRMWNFKLGVICNLAWGTTAACLRPLPCCNSYVVARWVFDVVVPLLRRLVGGGEGWFFLFSPVCACKSCVLLPDTYNKSWGSGAVAVAVAVRSNGNVAALAAHCLVRCCCCCGCVPALLRVCPGMAINLFIACDLTQLNPRASPLPLLSCVCFERGFCHRL